MFFDRLPSQYIMFTLKSRELMETILDCFLIHTTPFEIIFDPSSEIIVGNSSGLTYIRRLTRARISSSALDNELVDHSMKNVLWCSFCG